MDIQRESNLDAALIAIARNASASADEVNSEVLFTCIYTITQAEYKKASSIISMKGRFKISRIQARLALLGFWPLLLAVLVDTYTHNLLESYWAGYIVYILLVVINRINFARANKKAMASSNDVYEYPSRLYVTRSSLAFHSVYHISVAPWRLFDYIENSTDFYMVADKTQHKTIIPKRIFNSAEDSSLFFKLMKALLAGESIEHLIKPSESWPPKPIS